MMTNVCSIIRDTAPIVFLSHVKNIQSAARTGGVLANLMRFDVLLLPYSSTGAWGEQTAQLARKGRCSLLIRFLTLYLFVHFGVLLVYDSGQQSTSGQGVYRLLSLKLLRKWTVNGIK